ncbi:DUF3923 family protein [Virgibacillus sp. YIM 98842]|uniref:DUF3923 family protein n=1 Tax=Virgibacillus sp. YIM 98842 TaxID=2663533 RepID=UPI0013DA0E24|nr:DUF3923 family protein [Virgibacillus sp. YIM 98842]
MKKRWIFWWICSIFWFVMFVLGSAIIWLREVDGTGAVQTPELRLIAFVILLIGFIIPLIIQVVWLIINLRTDSNRA